MDENGHRLPEVAGRSPCFGKQGLEQRLLAARRAPPQDGDRHQLHVMAGILDRGADDTLEDERVAMARARRFRQRGDPVEKEMAVAGGQAGAAHFLAQHQQIRVARFLQDVIDRAARVEAQFAEAAGKHARPYPRIKQAGGDPVEITAERSHVDHASVRRRMSGRDDAGRLYYQAKSGNNDELLHHEALPKLTTTWPAVGVAPTNSTTPPRR